MRHISPIASAVLLSSALTAQGVPYGGSIVSVISNSPPSEGLWFADRTGASTLITGLIPAGSVGNGVSCLRMDPIDDRIWLGGINNGGDTSGQINYIRVTAGVVTQFVQHATTGLTSSINALEFDDNGNPIAVGTGGVFRIDRKNGGLATNIGTMSGTPNAVTRDAAGNLYVGVFGFGTVHLMTKNPDGSFQAPLAWGSVATTGINGLTYAPATANGGEALYVTTSSTGGNNVYRIAMPAGGIGTLLPTTSVSLNWVEYDRRQDDVLLLQTGPTDRLISLHRATNVETQTAVLGSGVVGAPSSIDNNDDEDNRLRIAPMQLNGSSGPFDIELSMTSPPGTIGAIAIVQPTFEILGFGLAGADGRFHLAYPNLTFPGGIAPGAIVVGTAILDFSGNIAIGQLINWPAN